MFISNGRSMFDLVQSNYVQRAVFILITRKGNTFGFALESASLLLLLSSD